MSMMVRPFGFGAGGGSSDVTVAHRYWRIFIPAGSTTGGATEVGFAQVEFYESKFGVNVAVSGTASASSNAASFPPANAFNGTYHDNGVVGWASAVNGASSDQTLSYDLGASVTKKVNAVGIQARATLYTQQPTAFSVYYSDDGTSWTFAWSVSGLSWSGYEHKRILNPAHTPSSYTGSPHPASLYWRVLCLKTDGDVNSSIGEAEFLDTPTGTDQATGGTASASSIYSATYSADKAFDNNTATLWNSINSGGLGSWLRYQFAATEAIGSTTIQSRTDGFTTTNFNSFLVQFSSGGTAWSTAYGATGQTGWTTGQKRTFNDPNYV